jgi:uncharacterized protein YdhG (YjbR/CyaY superfamily)
MPVKDADAYLCGLSADKRATLERVRRAIRAAAPQAKEGMSYGMPAFIQGKPIAGYSASANHCSYFPMSGAITAKLGADLAAYETSKGGFRFPIGKPPPAALIRKLVKARLTEIDVAASAGKKSPPAARRKRDAAVQNYLAGLAHPLKKEIEAVSTIVLGVSPAIREGIKWKVVSFRTEKEWFATFNTRAKHCVQLIFHLGVKKRSNLKTLKIADPNHLVKWLGNDRAMVTLGAGRDIVANRKAFEAIVRAWIKHL